MSGLIKKIDSIKNMAVYKDFQWSRSIRDEGNNIAEFKRINIFYGRIYSGKTTLSRIVRATETGILSDKYINPEFNVSFDDGSSISKNSLNTHDHFIRVFNEDFIKDNLRFISDDEQPINSFAILGEDNSRLEEEIVKNEGELGSDEDKTGLIGELLEVSNKYNVAERSHRKKHPT